jgi:acyl-lipid omega-6 desaturase (Delta-12 desaturase)
MNTSNNQLIIADRSWEKVVMKYNHPNLPKSIWQICNTLIPYLLLWYAIYQSLHYSYIITFLLAILASGFLIRLFIIFHDCGHGSFFKSTKTNDTVGIILGILAFTPYYKWHQQHHIHHTTVGNLDKRGIGDVWTLTVEEYQKLSKRKQLFYRIFRNPWILFSIGPLFLILVQNRLSNRNMSSRERWNTYFTNIVLLILTVLLGMLIGFKTLLIIQLPLLYISHCIGLWLFYMQHQFDDVSWERNINWDYKTAAIKGSSFLKLPYILQWFTGNIGFHHVHHLSSKIPNYNLAHCHYENEMFKDIKPIMFFKTFKALNLSLWDEASQRMTSFRKLLVNI